MTLVCLLVRGLHARLPFGDNIINNLMDPFRVHACVLHVLLHTWALKYTNFNTSNRSDPNYS